MYFFLSLLAFTDISFLSVTTPKMLVNMLTHSHSITSTRYILQVYVFTVFGSIDSFAITSMAYDRYMTICHPLCYITIMDQNLCVLLVVVSWALSSANSSVHTLLLACLSHFRNNTIPHYFCDFSTLMKLFSSDTTINELVILVLDGMVISMPFIYILVSYGHTSVTILKSPPWRESAKPHMCISPLCGFLYYGAIIELYFVPSSSTLMTIMPSWLCCTL